jgi:hypothetical protein
MNSAFTDNHAETKAVRIARAAFRAALACALVFGTGTALAQQHGDRRDDPAQLQQQQQQQGGRGRFWLPQQDRDPREAEQRAYEEQQRRAQQQQQQERSRGSGRLTPDERRDLRRQINEAGMDLYPRRR